MVRPTWNKTFMDIVEKIAERSLCLKYKTACIIVDGTQIISIGYNGTQSHCIECSDYWKEYHKDKDLSIFEEWIQSDNFKDLHREWSKKNEIHAESNALTWISKRLVNNYTLYTLYSPCDLCAKEILNYGIKNIYYRYQYPSGKDSLKLLEGKGIVIKQV